MINNSVLGERYDVAIDRKSAYELLKARAEKSVEQDVDKNSGKSISSKKRKSRRGRQSVWEAMAKSIARAVGSTLGRRLIRGALGTLLKS